MKRVIDWMMVIAGWLAVLIMAGCAVGAWWIPIPWLNVVVSMGFTAITLVMLGFILEPTMEVVRPGRRGWK